MPVHIRAFVEADWPQVWPIVREVVRAADTFAYDPAMTEAQAHDTWIEAPPGLTVVAVDGDRILGTAQMGPNRPGPGSHVATASFMVAADARGPRRGRPLCRFALDWAREQGFAGMQFNAVVESNHAVSRSTNGGSGLVRQAILTPAHVSDKTPFLALVQGDEQAVGACPRAGLGPDPGADRGYDGWWYRQELARRGIGDGIMAGDYRRGRSQPGDRTDPGAGQAQLRDPQAAVRLPPGALSLTATQRAPASAARRRPEPAPGPGAGRVRRRRLDHGPRRLRTRSQRILDQLGSSASASIPPPTPIPSSTRNKLRYCAKLSPRP